MRSKVMAIAVVVSVAASVVGAAGNLQIHTITSSALGDDIKVAVYLPEGYTPGGPGFPVIYYFRGDASFLDSGDFKRAQPHRSVFDIEAMRPALDEMIGQGLMDPVIVVEPLVKWVPFPGISDASFPTFAMNSSAAGLFRDCVVQDLIPWVDCKLNTEPDRDHRYITGHEFGAYGGLRLAIERPDLFSSATAMQGSFEWNWTAAWIDSVLVHARALGETPPYDYSPENSVRTRVVRAMARLFLPNPAQADGYDFFLDSDGGLRTEVWQRFVDQSIPRILQRAQPADLRLFFAVGEQDTFFHDHAANLAATLDSIGLPYVFRDYPGGHDFNGLDAVRKRFAVHATFHRPLTASAEFSPRVADARLHPGRLRVAVELPGEMDVGEIDERSVKLVGINGCRLACPLGCLDGHEISDVNGNGRPDLSVWMSCGGTVCAANEMGAVAGDSVTLTVRGELGDGRFFVAADTVVIGENHTAPAVD